MEDIVSDVQKKFGTDAIRPLSDYQADHDAGFITSGCFSMDWVVGRPGIPLGRIVEIYGPYSSGKSTIAASCLASCQRNGGATYLVDSEHSYSDEWARTFGLDTAKLYLMDPDHLKAMFEQIAFLCKTIVERGITQPSLIVIDSVSAFPVPEELEFLEGGKEKDASKAMGLHARYCAKGFRILSNLIWDSKVAIICVSQLKDNPMMPYAKSKLGGAAVDFHAAVQLQTNRTHKDEQSITVRLRCQKNKVAPPFRETMFDVIFNHGIDDSYAIAQAGVALGLITIKGSGWCTHVPTGASFRQKDIVEQYGLEIVSKVFPELVPPDAESPTSEPSVETAQEGEVAEPASNEV